MLCEIVSFVLNTYTVAVLNWLFVKTLVTPAVIPETPIRQENDNRKTYFCILDLIQPLRHSPSNAITFSNTHRNSEKVFTIWPV